MPSQTHTPHSQHTIRRRNRRLALASVLVLAVLVRVAAAIVLPLNTSPAGDQSLLVELATSLAQGRGFQLPEGTIFWPDRPTVYRSPGWPLMMSLVYRVTPDAWRWGVARSLNIAFDCFNAVLIVMLALRLGLRLSGAWTAGLLYACHPILAGIAVGLARDAVGITFVLLFLVAMTYRRETRLNAGPYLLGGLALGYGCLIRTNWVLIAFFSALAFLWSGRRRLTRTCIEMAIYTIAVCAPLTPWLARNAAEFDRFPLFGAGGGETLWGGNNALAAEVGGKWWGYFVFPNNIPGEEPLASLATRMTELEVDDYYRQKGRQWIRKNPTKMPGLILGKAIRAYLPIPRTRGLVVLAGSTYRWLIYVLAAVGIGMALRRGHRLDPGLAGALLGVALAQFVTVVVFCGYFRYVVASELLLVIPAGWALALFVQRDAPDTPK